MAAAVVVVARPPLRVSNVQCFLRGRPPPPRHAWRPRNAGERLHADGTCTGGIYTQRVVKRVPWFHSGDGSSLAVELRKSTSLQTHPSWPAVRFGEGMLGGRIGGPHSTSPKSFFTSICYLTLDAQIERGKIYSYSAPVAHVLRRYRLRTWPTLICSAVVCGQRNAVTVPADRAWHAAQWTLRWLSTTHGRRRTTGPPCRHALREHRQPPGGRAVATDRKRARKRRNAKTKAVTR